MYETSSRLALPRSHEFDSEVALEYLNRFQSSSEDGLGLAGYPLVFDLHHEISQQGNSAEYNPNSVV